MLTGGILVSMIFLTFREYMDAREASGILKKRGIKAKLSRTPGVLAKNGCGYGIWIPGVQQNSTMEELKKLSIRHEKAYLYDGKNYREMET